MSLDVLMLAARGAGLAARLDMLIVLGLFIAAGFALFGVFRLARWHDQWCERELAALLAVPPLERESEGPLVRVVFHTYRGLLVRTTQQEHRFVGTAPWALEWLDRLHGFNLRSNWKNPGSLWIPLLSWWNLVAQRRSVRRQARDQSQERV
jgi:hypothetical protein